MVVAEVAAMALVVTEVVEGEVVGVEDTAVAEDMEVEDTAAVAVVEDTAAVADTEDTAAVADTEDTNHAHTTANFGCRYGVS
jgi:hypothetical protein